ncbi:MAG TPA: hypothetical protein DEB40_01550 [Elusimicrobia bacterium]|nr:hypothetical protein [Elusimicrobiota bacterium]HBT60414.1 hypothetical protein [Elusimicrobiota bacterium]
MKYKIRFLLLPALTLLGLSAWGQEAWLGSDFQRQLQRGRVSALALKQSVEEHGRSVAPGRPAPRQTFKEVLDEVYQGKEGSADLSQAASGRQFFIYNHIQYRDAVSEEFRDYKGKAVEESRIVTELAAVDLYWAAHLQQGDAQFVEMESFYLFNFRVVGCTLYWHQILSNMRWVKGDVPFGKEMSLIEHAEQRLAAGQQVVATRVIGQREFRITVGFYAK